MAPTLFADRFLARGDRALDLATGGWVSLCPATTAGRAAEQSWAARCAALSSMAHPHLLGLVDYGLAGRDQRFEALAAASPGTPWRSRDEATGRALFSVVAFLHARGRSAGCLSWSRIVDRDGRPVLVPDAGTGTPWGGADGSNDHDPHAAASEIVRLARMTGRSWRAPDRCVGAGVPAEPEGVETVTPDLVARLAEVFEAGEPARPRAVRLALPPDARRLVALSQIAREARLRGYVPVNTKLLDDGAAAGCDRDDLREVLADRHVLLIHDRTSGRPASLALLLVALGLSNSRPHVVALVGDAMRGGAHARERPAPYAIDGDGGRRRAPVLQLARAAGCTDPVAARAQANLGAATGLAAAGRHAAAERMLREGLGALGRRGDALGAAWAGIALGCLLRVRGRPLHAAACFERAREQFEAARAAGAAGRCGVHLALAWTDLGRLEEAEAASRAVLLAAQETGDVPLREQAAQALARCLLWQERFVEGLQALDSLDPAAVTPCASKVAEVPPPFETASMPGGGRLPGAVDLEVTRACLTARLGLALGDLALAGRAAGVARRRGAACGDAASLAAAATALLRVYAALGDLEGAERARDCAFTAARRARDPLRALRVRIAWVEALARAGAAAETTAAAGRLARLDRPSLPWVVRQALGHVVRLAASGTGATAAARARGPTSSPLRLAAASGTTISLEALLDDIVEVLGLCQGPEDDEAVLRAVSSRLRRRHRLAALACFALSEGTLVAVASEGSSPPPETAARRAVEVGRALPPEAFADRNQAAVPVRYAGAVVGALAGRWAADETPDWGRTGAVLAAAAAAIAPAVRAVADRRAAASAARGVSAVDEIVGVSGAAATLRREIERAAAVPFNVLIEGESGTGKELVARALHQRGPRRHRRLCAVNCAALSDELFEAEVFGHSRGAFTGAVAERKGLFEEADGGTLVLDEVGELTPRAQAKLLRALQEGEVRRIGENFSRAVDVRVVASTNRPLRAAAEEGRFRRDLLYRLDVVRIVVPPLRDRIEDIPVLAAHFWQVATNRLASRATLSPPAITALARYDWPGNIRELQNVIAALAVAVGPRGSAGPSLLPGAIAGAASPVATTLEQARTVFEARYVRAALARSGGRRGDAARELGVTRQGLSKLLARLSIEA